MLPPVHTHPLTRRINEHLHATANDQKIDEFLADILTGEVEASPTAPTGIRYMRNRQKAGTKGFWLISEDKRQLQGEPSSPAQRR